MGNLGFEPHDVVYPLALLPNRIATSILPLAIFSSLNENWSDSRQQHFYSAIV